MLFPSAAYIIDEQDQQETCSEHKNDVFGDSVFSSFKQQISSSGGDNSSPSSSSSCNDNRVDEKICTESRRKYKHENDANNFDNDKKKNREGESSDWSSKEDVEHYKEKRKKRKEKHRKKRKQSSADSSSAEVSRHYKHKKKKTKKKKHAKHSRCNTVPVQTKPDTIWLEETNLDPGQAFRKDKRPDSHNFEYGTLYKMDIASFWKPVKIPCLGLTKDQKVVLYEHKTKKQRKNKHDDKVRYFYNTAKAAALYTDEEEESEFVHTLESELFIPVKKNKMPTTSDTTDVIKYNDSDVNHSQRNRQFSQKLLDDPHDVSTWLEFVDAQNDLCPWSNDPRQKQDWRTSKSLSEKKISILEKALLKNPSSIELILRHMTLLKEVWSPNDVKDKWNKLLFQFPNRSRMWLEYLDFMQTDLIGMTVNNVIDAYRKCFRILFGIHCGTMKSHPPELNSSDGLVMVLVHLLVFLWQSGHTEKATTLIQCFIELNTSTSHRSTNRLDRLKAFEQYFDSDAPRFGEKDYVNWDDHDIIKDHTSTLRHGTRDNVTCITSSPCQNSPTFDDVVSSHSTETDLSVESTNKQKLWIRLEEIRSTCNILGYRGNQEECEDTERIVLFDDVSFALFIVDNDGGLFQVLLTYFLMLGVPVPRSQFNKNLFDFVCENMLITKSTEADSCFCHNEMFCGYISISSVFRNDLGLNSEVIIEMARRTLNQSLLFLCDRHVQILSQIWLHFETVLFRRSFENVEHELSKKYWKEMRRFIKSLLKLPPNRSCVALWDMYATYEWNLGNEEDSQKILTTSMQLYSGLTNEENNCLQVARTIRCILNLFIGKDNVSAKKNTLLNIYLAFLQPTKQLQFSPSVPNSLQLLKVSTLLKSEYARIQDKPLLEAWASDEVEFICCYLVFMYLFAGYVAIKNIVEELLSRFEMSEEDINGKNFSDMFKCSLTVMKEYVDVSYENFNSYKSVVERAVKLFSSDELIIGFYTDVKKHGLNSLEVRRTFESSINVHHSLVPWLLYLKYEERRLASITLLPYNNTKNTFEILDSKTGVHNRMRALYERMLGGEQFRYNAHLWWMSLEFHLKYFGQKAAKDVLYTALRNCPSSKALFTRACGRLDNFEELYDMMAEKEVRVRLLVEEMDLLLMDRQ